MRRIRVLCLAVVLALWLWGCKEKAPETPKEEAKKAVPAEEKKAEEKKAEEKAAEEKEAAEVKATAPEAAADAAPTQGKQDGAVEPSAIQQEADKAREIVARAVEAMGGEELLRAKCSSFSVKSKGTFYGMPYVMTSLWKAPDRMVMAMDDGSMTMGYAGTACWNRFNTIVRDCMPDELASFPETLWSYHVMSLYPLLGEGFDLEYKGLVDLDDKSLEQVEVTGKDAPMAMVLGFDAATGLLVQAGYEGHFGGKKGDIVMEIVGYTDLEGMKVMSKSVMRMDGKELMEDELLSAEWAEVPDEAFARPPQATFGEPAVRTEPEMMLALNKHKGPYETIGMTIGMTYGWLGMNQVAPWGPPTMEYDRHPDNTEKPEDYVTYITIPVMAPEGEPPKSETIRLERVPERRIAVRVEQGPPDAVVKAYPELAKWVEEQGLIVASAPSMTSFDDPRQTPPEKQIHELFFVVGRPAADTARAEAATAAARGFWDACAKKDWETAATWYAGMSDEAKEYYGGIEVQDIGTAFEKFPGYPGLHVYYKVKFPEGRVKEWYLAIRDDSDEKKWVVDGGL